MDLAISADPYLLSGQFYLFFCCFLFVYYYYYLKNETRAHRKHVVNII